jgi:hypothetical protein
MDFDSNNYKPSIDDLISLRQAASFSGYTTSHLRLLISRGDLWAKKIDSLWVTTEIAINDYLENKLDRGRPRNDT